MDPKSTIQAGGPLYEAGMVINYTNAGLTQTCTILTVHLDYLMEPFYTVRLPDGREVQTDSTHISLRNSKGDIGVGKPTTNIRLKIWATSIPGSKTTLKIPDVEARVSWMDGEGEVIQTDRTEVRYVRMKMMLWMDYLCHPIPPIRAHLPDFLENTCIVIVSLEGKLEESRMGHRVHRAVRARFQATVLRRCFRREWQPKEPFPRTGENNARQAYFRRRVYVTR
jgi:hypothetical protein